MPDGIFFITVFIGGMLSFALPCILPLIPAYLTYLSGRTATIAIEGSEVHNSVVWNSLAFISGFIIVFVLMGAAATSVGQFLLGNQDGIRKAGGVFIAFMGLYHMGLIPLRFMNYERRFNMIPRAPGFFQSISMGVGFGFGWTPCMGPVLTSILIVASQADTVSTGMLLLAIYGIGLGIPFFALALGVRVLWKHMQILQRYMKPIKIVTGAVLVITGVLIYFNRLAVFMN